MNALEPLQTLPDGVASAATLVDGLDGCFGLGFGRLGADQARALDALGRAFAGTPLERPVGDAIAAVRRSEFVEKHFVALAAARAALQGAQHDALVAHAARCLGRAAPAAPPALQPPAQAAPQHHQVWLESARQWLMELALAGFPQLTSETLLPFAATLEKLQGEPALVRQSALLTGFFNELVGAMPVASMPDVPRFRWVDLWTRAMVLCARPPLAPASERVSGDLAILGADVRQHANMASLVAWGVLAHGGAARVVRATVSAYKVDVVLGAEAWRLFAEHAKQLVAAIAEDATLQLADMEILATGDLVWDDARARLARADAREVAAKWLAPGAGSGLVEPALAGIDRHPAQVAVPVYLDAIEGAVLDGAPAVRAAGATLRVATERMVDPADPPLDGKGPLAIVGLLRFDAGRWAIQPLTVVQRGGKKDVAAVAGAAAAERARAMKDGARDAALPILKERASKLLRK